ncbi:hypothetical protein Bbelb_373060 [Branchiostoma belcheri]|nr:hypothetical protein Bbelb_373060 [Branchiostoma belcheri]
MGSLLARLSRESCKVTSTGNTTAEGCSGDDPSMSLQELQSLAPIHTSTSRTEDADCPSTQQVFVKGLDGKTRCVDVREDSTVEELMCHLQKEKVLPPGGSLIAKSKKLKKSQLVGKVSSNIEVALALNGGVPPKSTKPTKKLSGNVRAEKGCKQNAEDLRKRIEESIPGLKLSKHQLGRVLSAVFQNKVHRGRCGKKDQREYYYYGIKLIDVEDDEKSHPSSENNNEKSLPSSEDKDGEEIRALKSDLERMKEKASMLQGQVEEQSRAIAKLECSKSKLKEQCEKRLSHPLASPRQDLRYSNYVTTTTTATTRTTTATSRSKKPFIHNIPFLKAVDARCLSAQKRSLAVKKDATTGTTATTRGGELRCLSAQKRSQAVKNTVPPASLAKTRPDTPTTGTTSDVTCKTIHSIRSRHTCTGQENRTRSGCELTRPRKFGYVSWRFRDYSDACSCDSSHSMPLVRTGRTGTHSYALGALVRTGRARTHWVHSYALGALIPGRHGEYVRIVSANNPARLDARRAIFVMSYMEHVPYACAASLGKQAVRVPEIRDAQTGRRKICRTLGRPSVGLCPRWRRTSRAHPPWIS